MKRIYSRGASAVYMRILSDGSEVFDVYLVRDAYGAALKVSIPLLFMQTQTHAIDTVDALSGILADVNATSVWGA